MLAQHPLSFLARINVRPHAKKGQLAVKHLPWLVQRRPFVRFCAVGVTAQLLKAAIHACQHGLGLSRLRVTAQQKRQHRLKCAVNARGPVFCFLQLLPQLAQFFLHGGVGHESLLVDFDACIVGRAQRRH